MGIELKFGERLFLLGALPKKGKEEKMIVSRDFKNKIKITQDEIVKYDLKTNEQGYLTWKLELDKDTIKVELTQLEELFLKDLLSSLNKEENLQEEILDFYLKYK